MLNKSQRKKIHRSCSRAHQGRFIGLLNNRFGGKGGAVCAVQRRFSLRWPKMGTPLSYIVHCDTIAYVCAQDFAVRESVARKSY